MKTALIRLLLGWLGFCLCGVASAFLWVTLIDFGTSEEKWWLMILTALVLLFCFVAVMRAYFRWPIRDFLGSYFAGLLTLSLVPAFISHDSPIFDIDTLWVVFFYGLWTLLPWFGGFDVGTRMLRRRERRKLSGNASGVSHP